MLSIERTQKDTIEINEKVIIYDRNNIRRRNNFFKQNDDKKITEFNVRIKKLKIGKKKKIIYVSTDR